jgi:16S rRNA (guanine527-N7)-methyltransferase
LRSVLYSPEQLEGLCRDILPDLPPAVHGKLGQYVGLVGKYSQALNLTGFAPDPETLVGELIGEAVKLLELGPVAPGTSAVDLGSGSGCPVVPLAVLCPAARFTAVEARQRRATFLRAVQASLSLGNLAVAEQRAEEVAAERPGAFHLLTSRAFAPPERLLRLALKLLAKGGEVRGFLGAAPGTLDRAASALGMTVVSLVSYVRVTSARHVYLLQV